MDKKNGYICFKINKELAFQVKDNQMLKDRAIKWVPYAFLGNKEDAVEFGDMVVH